jgi:hypothetical protein
MPGISETKGIPTLLVACPRYQERHNSNAPQLAVHRRYSFEQTTSEWSAVHSEDTYLLLHNGSLLEQFVEGDDWHTEICKKFAFIIS